MAEREPGQARRDRLRSIFRIYTWGLYIPFLAVWTVLLGAVAVLVSLVSQRASFHIGTFWAWVLCRAIFVRVRVRGREHLKDGASFIIMSNHQSHFDVLAFYGHWLRQFRWVLKEELRRTPGIGWYCAAGGHLFIDRSCREKAVASLKRAGPLLAGGISVMIFPEGTRSTSGRLRSFKKGGFMLALDMGLPILPVSISGSRHVAPNKTVRPLPGSITITIHEPVDPAAYGVERREELMQDVRRSIHSGLSEWEQQEKK